MTDIPTDARFSYLDITESLSINETICIDNKRNVNCNELRCNRIITNEILNTQEDRSFNPTQFEPSMNDYLKQSGNNCFTLGTGSNHCDGKNSTVLGGDYNESFGSYSTIIGGKENENNGNYSIVLGGKFNQCFGNFSACFGVNGVAQHDNTFIWNSDEKESISTTNVQQCLINAVNGVFMKLPKSNMIRTDHVPDGFMCFCWDPIDERICMKTKQNGTLYISQLATLPHEISVQMQLNGGNIEINLTNPDHT